MPARRPASLTVFAILSMVFGGLWLFCGVCSGVLQVASSSMNFQQSGGGKQVQFDQKEYERHLEEKVPGYKIMQWGSVLLMFFRGFVMIGLGIGFLKMQTWARFGAMAYGLFDIVVPVVLLIFNVVFVLPAVEEYFQLHPMPFAPPPWSYIASAAIGALLVMLYAAILLVWALLPSTGRAFAAGAAGAAGDVGRPEGPDYYDEDYRRERRDLPPES